MAEDRKNTIFGSYVVLQTFSKVARKWPKPYTVFYKKHQPRTTGFGTLGLSSWSHKMNKLDSNDMMNAPSANQGVGCTDDNGWVAPTLPKKYANEKAFCDPRSWLYPPREKTSLWGFETLKNDIPLLNDGTAPQNSNATEVNDNLDSIFQDYTWPLQPDPRAHNALPDEHENAISEWGSTPRCTLETTRSTSTHGHTWLVPIWDERDEDARFWSNAKNSKASRDLFFPISPSEENMLWRTCTSSHTIT
jgi:hypothetical protein